MGHIDLSEKIKDNVLDAYYATQRSYGGKVTLDFDKLRWKMKATMEDMRQTSKNIEEKYGIGSNQIKEYIKIEINMHSSWSVGKSRNGEVSLELPANCRLTTPENRTGTPSTITFPHNGTKTVYAEHTTPLPVGSAQAKFLERTIEAKMIVETTFDGTISVKNGFYGLEEFEANDLLEKAGVLKSRSWFGSSNFKSVGDVKIEIRQMQ